jgi:2-oxoglutarate dehydrogenase E2 component (dihydrolipoamide succinyltransferase)
MPDSFYEENSMDIQIPEIGESIIEAKLAKWHCRDGQQVSKDDLLCELETDKITLELFAEKDGIVHIRTTEGETVPIGTVVATLEENSQPDETAKTSEAEAQAPEAPEPEKHKKPEPEPSVKPDEPPMQKRQETVEPPSEPTETEAPQPGAPFAEPEEDLKEHETEERRTRREPLSPLRQTIARRLLEARQQTAMATTFNEADLSRVLDMREHHGERFLERHGIKLGLMSFFVKASVEALGEFPIINARLEEDAVVYQDFYDIGIAVATEQGLVAPILRDAERLHFAEIEKRIAELADKARQHRLALADLQGGTFSISNGGVYGSLLSTPLLNPPQSAILGMHAIQQRAVVRDDKIVARPMMYLALSYDHRLIDGREAVKFLKRLVELVEEPEELLLE